VQTKKKRKSSTDAMDTDTGTGRGAGSKVSSCASDNSSLLFSTPKTMDSRISMMEHGLTQLKALMNQILTQISQPKPAPAPPSHPKSNNDLVTPVTPSHKYTNKDKASNPSMKASKPERWE
jgi:hypothetical protein